MGCIVAATLTPTSPFCFFYLFQRSLPVPFLSCFLSKMALASSPSMTCEVALECALSVWRAAAISGGSWERISGQQAYSWEVPIPVAYWVVWAQLPMPGTQGQLPESSMGKGTRGQAG